MVFQVSKIDISSVHFEETTLYLLCEWFYDLHKLKYGAARCSRSEIARCVSWSQLQYVYEQVPGRKRRCNRINSEILVSLIERLTFQIDPESSPRENDFLWTNCLLGRLLFDMHDCPETINLIQDKIQRKLSNIKLPYFMESLLVSELVIGQDAPTIHKITKPTLDERGLWLDLDITYKGYLTMTVETKLNLMKLTRASTVPTDVVDEKSVPTRSPMFDSDVEDSPETSTEDEDVANIASCDHKDGT